MNLEKTSDEDIVKKVQNGDAQKFGEIITRFEAKLKRYIYRMIGSNFELEDILQDVFLKSYKNIQSFNSKMKFSSWIYRIAHNESVNYLKKARKQREQGGLEDNMQKDNGEESMYEKAEKDTGIELDEEYYRQI